MTGSATRHSTAPAYRQRTRQVAAQAGFTIIELLIATLVFSMVIIIITVGVLSFTHSYYKGVNQSNTQTTARQIIEDVSQAIQLSGSEISTPLSATGSSKGFCIGNLRYSYVLGKQLSDDNPLEANQAHHVLVVDKKANCAGDPAQDVLASPSGTELLQPRMRLSKLSVEPLAGNTYRINIRLVYGDDDLLNNPAGNGTPATNIASCKTDTGSTEYCAVSELTTVVKKRIGL